MTVWYAIPTAREPELAERCLARWREMGYRLALWRDHPVSLPCTLELRGTYPGYNAAINALAGEILKRYPETEWIVSGGDDMEPDAQYWAGDIARQCTEHFGGTFGVMQPTGDRWGEPGQRPYSERVAGSPWMGREWCRRINGGRGPLHPYYHFHGDEELQCVAENLGVFWQRRDLIHLHRHYVREKVQPPQFYARVSPTFRASEAEFRRRKAQGFPGHEPLVPYRLVFVDGRMKIVDDPAVEA